jgi:hypothetical protein
MPATSSNLIIIVALCAGLLGYWVAKTFLALILLVMEKRAAAARPR